MVGWSDAAAVRWMGMMVAEGTMGKGQMTANVARGVSAVGPAASFVSAAWAVTRSVLAVVTARRGGAVKGETEMEVVSR